MESIIEKLRSLGLQTVTGREQTTSVANDTRLEDIIEGEDIVTDQGTVFTVEKRYPADYYQGAIPLLFPGNLHILSEWNKSPQLIHLVPEQLLFLDTETSGISGGTGTFAFLVGLGFYNQSTFQVVQLFLRDPAEEKALLDSLSHYLSRFRAIITFNGKAFDLPILKSRYILAELTEYPPIADMDHIDLLQLARRLWRDRLASRALRDLEDDILHFTRDQEDIPGWMIPDVYFDYLRTGNASKLSRVFYHNAMDILSMAALFNTVLMIINDPHSELINHSLDLAALAKLYEEIGRIDEAAELYERSIEQGLPHEVFIRTLHRYAQLHRRQSNWLSAVRIWKKAAEHHDIAAHIELAKYFEHFEQDFDTAIYWAEQARRLFGMQKLTGTYLHTITIAEIEHRLARLTQKACSPKLKRAVLEKDETSD